LSDLIIFDLDGVITSEEAYWDAAGLTLHELCYSPRYWQIGAVCAQYIPVTTAVESRHVSRTIFPTSEILSVKARAINSNWDTSYVTVCLHLIDLLSRLPDVVSVLPLQPWDATWLAGLREQLTSLHLHFQGEPFVSMNLLDAPVFQGAVGLELINRFDAYATQALGYDTQKVFSRHSPLWTFCQDIFQEWYLGDRLYTESYGHAPAQPGKPGCIHFEQPLLPLEKVRKTLATLQEQGYSLGCASGRTYQEASYPLKAYGLWNYFSEEHIATYDYVERAEAVLRAQGGMTLLGKPHPFQFLIAVDHTYEPEQTHKQPAPASNFIVVGDSTSDILGGRAAGGLTVAVLTGANTSIARQRLAASGPDFTLDDVTGLPDLLAHIDSLATIQRLQFTERAKAERLLQRWFARHMHLVTESVTLTPKAVSLNSFNGFYRLNGEEYFFKTHIEEQGILEEYYHAELLHQAGYNIVRPLQTLHEEGRQMVIYPVVHWPIMFDLMRAVETGQDGDIALETLVAAEKRECARLLAIYEATLAPRTAAENASAPIHQLFWHRLTGGRLQSFYAGKIVPFLRQSQGEDAVPGIPFEELLEYHWTINGPGSVSHTDQQLQFTLGELIERAKAVLDPRHESISVIGHGDAHYGNVFLEDQRDYLYFDPAFAGRHTPLLDIIKPLYHNVFATWMYFPHEVVRDLELSVSVYAKQIYIEHNYALAPVRRAIASTKREYLLYPLMSLLKAHGVWHDSDEEMLKLALMCCPLLTINLLDAQRIPPAITWLGLVHAVQLGQVSMIDDVG
jgi:phosphoglycolate phosphatase-like HAD superfamily hydrolase